MISSIENRFVEGYPAWIAVGPGWRDILVRLDRQLSAIQSDYKVAQVKEKFGGLRFYTSNVRPENMDEFRSLIDAAEHDSYRTCEECGDRGSLRDNGWYKTLCEVCNEVF